MKENMIKNVQLKYNVTKNGLSFDIISRKISLEILQY